MKCPRCGKEMEKGYVYRAFVGSGFNGMLFSDIRWYPEEDDKKAYRSKNIGLRDKAVGYYCDHCEKVFAEFDAKPKLKERAKDILDQVFPEDE